MNSIQITDVNLLNKLGSKKNSNLMTRPFLPAQKPDTFEKTTKSFNIDNAIKELKEIKQCSFKNEPVFDDKQLKQIKDELSKSPEKYESLKTIANSKFMEGDIACKLLKKDLDSLKELADITNIKNNDYFKTQRFEPKDLEKFADELSAKELYKFKYIAEGIYDENSVIRLAKNKNLKTPEKVPTVIKEMKEKYYGKNSSKSVELYGDFDDKKAFVCYARLKNGEATQLLDSNLNKLAIEESTKFSKNGNNYETKKSVDYRTNTISKSTEKLVDGSSELISEIRIVKDKKGKKIYTEYTTKSDIDGVLNIKHIMPDGSERILSSATVDPKTGLKTIKQNLTSLDGTKTVTLFTEDAKGNRNLSYKITDKNGKVLLDNNKKFEVINENKFVSTSNGNKFEMTFSDKDVNIKNLQDGKISKIDFKNLIDGNKNDAIELIKKLSGEELLALKENVNKLKVEKYVITGGCYECETKNVLSNNNFDTLLHELGHAKDHTLKNEKNNIRNGKISYGNKNIVKSFEEEKKLFIKNFPQTQRKQIWYFLSDGLNEIVAESNMLINYHANGNGISARARVLQQYFPKTIALIAQELNK